MTAPSDHNGHPATRPDSTARLDALEARMAQLAGDLRDLSAALAPDPSTEGSHGGDDGAETAVEPVFDTLQDWVDQYYIPVFTRPIGGTIRWCDQWNEHPEATLRLEALWRSWETLRLDPNLGIAVWLTSYADHLMATLLAAHGPFARCAPQRHSPAA